MERLTKPAVRLTGSKYVSALGSGNGVWPRIIQRLAEYENTGLMPEEIEELLNKSYGPAHITIARGLDLIEAENEGRIVVMPSCPEDCAYRRARHQKCSCCKRNLYLKDCYEGRK